MSTPSPRRSIDGEAHLTADESSSAKPAHPAELPKVSLIDQTLEESPLTGVLTADEVREINEQGITLEDAIRSIMASWE